MQLDPWMGKHQNTLDALADLFVAPAESIGNRAGYLQTLALQLHLER